ncbi:MAG: methionine--tRNA ligase [Planctomycetia bacterium]|nr:methionine--tRNA ligase [Planctomycetia bacterium]
MAKFYITTAIDYANSNPHTGTAYEKIGADAIARWKRLQGHDVWFLMGMDEHSMNVEKKAQSLGMDPEKYCDGMEPKFTELWKALDISYDDFIRTTQKRHIAAATEFFRRVHAKGDIYKARYSGLYCVGCEAYLKPADLVEGKCKNHGTEPQKLEEENWFFRLSKYTQAMIEHIERNPDFVKPDVRRNEVLNVAKEGLEDISISRATFKFGIPLPVDPAHVMYVWFDALINYISAVGFASDEARFAKWWPADLHVIGKDITRFHCLLWPAMLMSAGVPLPGQVWGHGWVHYKGQKMSKSTGHLLDPFDVINPQPGNVRFENGDTPKIEAIRPCGADALRYFLLREVSWDRDGDFTWEAFIARYNADLANDLGNLLHRTLKMVNTYCGGAIPAETEAGGTDADMVAHMDALPRDVGALMDAQDLSGALGRIWDAVRRANSYIEEAQPWALNKQGKAARVGAVMTNLATAIARISALVYPFLPSSAGKIREQLGLPPKPEGVPGAWAALPAGHKVREGAVLFPRIETEKKDAPAAGKPRGQGGGAPKPK